MMRRSMLLTGSLVFTLIGCGGDAFSAHSDIAAEAAGQQLTAQRVADILTQVKNVPVTPEAAEFVASLWVDYTVFAQAVADGSITSDSSMVAEAMWVDVTEMSLTHFLDSVIAGIAEVTPEKIDSAYNADGLRVLQHVLIVVDPNAPEAERVAARRSIDRILVEANNGADFGALALEHSGDPSAQADSGYLPPSPRGAFVAPFDSAAWLLGPGEISGVVVTSYGFHIIRRPMLADLGDRLEPRLNEAISGSAQQAYLANLDSLNNIKIASGGVARAREVFANLDQARGGNGKIVNYEGGALTEDMLAFFTRSATADPNQGPELLNNLKQAPDSMLEGALEGVAMQYVMVREANRAGVTPTPEEWENLKSIYQQSVDSLRLAIGLGDDVLDPNASADDRSRAAALRVDGFFTDVLTGADRLRILPGMLAWTLRGKSDAFVNQSGVRQAVALAEAARAADSTSAAGGGLAPAQGGPPVPGATPNSPIQPAQGGPPVPGGE